MILLYVIIAAFSLIYFLIIGSITFGWFSLKKNTNHAIKPFYNVSVLIPFRNEEDHLVKLIQSMALINYPEEHFEIIFINDGSNDNSCNIAEAFAKRSSFSVRLIHSEEEGKKAAITLGVNQAKGDIIICTDADCTVQPAWISEMICKFEDPNLKMVLGPVSIAGKNNFWNIFQKIEFTSLIISSAGAVAIGQPVMANGANLAYRKNDFIKVDGYLGNEKISSGDDVFLMMKFSKFFGKSSITFLKSKNAVVNTNPQLTLNGFLKQRIRWASKSALYGTSFSNITAFSVLTMNLLLFIFLFLSPFNAEFACLFFIIWIGKTLIDLPLLLSGSIFFNYRKTFFLFPVIELITAVLTVIPGILSFFIKPEWKERRIRVK